MGPCATEPVHKECVETSELPILSVSDVDADPVTSWTEVVSKKKKRRKQMFPLMVLK